LVVEVLRSKRHVVGVFGDGADIYYNPDKEPQKRENQPADQQTDEELGHGFPSVPGIKIMDAKTSQKNCQHDVNQPGLDVSIDRDLVDACSYTAFDANDGFVGNFSATMRTKHKERFLFSGNPEWELLE